MESREAVRKRLDQCRADLHGIRSTPEGYILNAYLDTKLVQLSQKALHCDTNELHTLQGSARLAEEMLRDLLQGPSRHIAREELS